MSAHCRHIFRLGALLAGVFMLGAATVCGASSEWLARVWQSDDGLPDNSVTGVAQTADGYLWVATQGGLVRFDGTQFTRISLPITSGVPIEMIRALTVGEGNHLWLALEGGMVVSAGPQGTKVYTANDGLSLFRPASIAEGDDGAVWVGYSDGTACRIADQQTKRFAGKEGLPGTGLCWLATDAKKELWFAEADQVGRYRDGHFVTLATMPNSAVCIAARREGGIWICAGRKLYRYEEGHAPIKVAYLAQADHVMEPLALFEDTAGSVWVGTAANGLFRFDGTNVAQVETSRGEIRSVTEDREKNIWVGTSGGGLNRLRPRAMQLYGVAQGLPFETVRSVCEAGGQLWVVTQNGFLARSQGERWSVISTNVNGLMGQASCVASDESGAVWIGTIGNGLYRWANGKYLAFTKADGLVSDRVWTLMADTKSNLWVALNRPNCVQRWRDGQFEKFDLPSGSSVVRAMTEAADGTIWLGTEDGRLCRISNGALTDETTNTLAKPVAIRCLQGTPDGSLWIGYGGAGVGWLKEGIFMCVGREQGLPDDFISQIVPDGSGTLWFAGNRGIFEVKQAELEAVASGELEKVGAVRFGKNEGLPSLQANFGYGQAAVRMRDGRICFSMLTGLAVVEPGRIHANTFPPPVMIERVSVDGNSRAIPGAIPLSGNGPGASNAAVTQRALEVPPQNYELKIDFNALSFAAPENVRLRYQMAGYDPAWIETTLRTATYAKMPAGQYQFRVTACNNSGVWNEHPATLDLVVRPFFWQTWTFRLGFIVLFTAAVIAGVRYASFRRLRRKLLRLEQESAVQKDRARIAKDLHDDLGAHLSHIAMLSELAQSDLEQPAQAHGHLDQIFRNAQLVTRSLDEIVWAVNPRNDTLDRFVAHVCQFAPEFLRAAGIRSRLDMPFDLPPVQLEANVRHQLYLALKEALHNIVKHAGATEVWLRLTVDDDLLTVIIEDNGRGFETNVIRTNGEDGLANLQNRMTEIGGHFEQHSRAGQGTRLVFIAPKDGKMRKNPVRFPS